jgi:ribose-phosphate pyrophosphokinase
MELNSLRIFALDASYEFGDSIAAALEVPLSDHEEQNFEDGEHRIYLTDNVRGADVFVIHSLYSDEHQSVNDKLVRLLFMLGAVRDALAARITAVIPYLCYGRNDHASSSRDPVSARYLAQLMEAAGAQRILTLDVHNLSAYQNTFRCSTGHVEASSQFINYVAPLLLHKEAVVASATIEGIERSEAFRFALQKQLGKNVSSAFLQKSATDFSMNNNAVVGNVEGKIVVIIDDLIGNGTAISRMANACWQSGASEIIAVASHGMFTAEANENLVAVDINRIVVTNSVPLFRVTSPLLRDRLVVLDTAPLFADAIRRLHLGEPATALQSM